MHSIIHAWYAYVSAMFWQSWVVVAVVLFLYFLLRRASAPLRYAILCLVPVKLLLPASLCFPIGLGCLASFLRLPEKVAQTPLVLHNVFGAAEEPATGLFVLWLVGVGVLVLLHVYRFIRIGYIHRTAQPHTDTEVVRAVAYACVTLGLDAEIPVLEHKGGVGPVVVGLLRPRIILPHGINRSLSRDELQAVLRHELAHVKRGDIWMNLIQTGLQIIWFFHPGVWFVNRLIRTEREYACDDAAVFGMENSPGDYVRGIAKILGTRSSPPSSSPGLLGLFGQRSELFARLNRIASIRTSIQSRLHLTELVLTVGVAVVVLPLARPAGSSEAGTGSRKVDRLREGRATGLLAEATAEAGGRHRPYELLYPRSMIDELDEGIQRLGGHGSETFCGQRRQVSVIMARGEKKIVTIPSSGSTESEIATNRLHRLPSRSVLRVDNL